MFLVFPPAGGNTKISHGNVKHDENKENAWRKWVLGGKNKNGAYVTDVHVLHVKSKQKVDNMLAPHEHGS